MPSSKKGRLSGGARKEINERRANDAARGLMEGIIFARISKMLGANHVSAMYNSEHGPKELRARIPNIFARRGATPITTRDVVAIEVGADFDPDKAVIRPGDLFDVKAILTQRQVYNLQKEGIIPLWMSDHSSSRIDAEANPSFEFDYSAVVEEGEKDDKDSETAFSRKAAIDAAAAGAGDDELDIDHI
jgi:hypothetical protein